MLLSLKLLKLSFLAVLMFKKFDFSSLYLL